MSLEILSTVSLFESLTPDDRADLLAQMDTVEFAPGQLIFRDSQPGSSLYIVLEGEVELFFKNDTGERILLETSRTGDFFGELSLLDGGARTASALATERTKALSIDRAMLRTFLCSHPAATLGILAATGKRLRKNTELLRRTASRNVNEAAEDIRTPIGQAADAVAAFSGSIPFLGLHLLWFGVWISWNATGPLALRFDPFPFGFLTLVVSLEAIVLSVLVLLSQNRQTEKDRIRADVEYDVNLKAELEISQLHEKTDEFSAEVLARLAHIERLILVEKP
jgi:uncharacterized membrane protein